MRKKLYTLPSILFLFIFCLPIILPGQNSFKWKKISGRWEVRKDNKETYLLEKRAKSRMWGDSELINYNSIIKKKPPIDYTSIQFSMRVQSPVKPGVDVMTFFAAKHFREFYAFRFSGDKNELKRVRFIGSTIKDAAKTRSVKWNFIITNIITEECVLEYNKEYKIEIAILEKKAILYIDGKKVVEAESDRNLNNGRFGFSNRNVKLRIDNVKVFNGKEIVFKDDFSKDSIYRKILGGKLEKK